MTVAPEVQSLIDWSKSVNQTHAALALPELRTAVRDELDRELARRGIHIESVARTTDELLEVAGGVVWIRAFAPYGSGPHPVFVHIHGGGFVFGTIDSLVNDAKCAHICRAADCVVVTVEYRLAPEHRFPTAPQDCYAALLWTVANAERLNIDPARLAVGGESAGGNLAAVVALMVRDLGGPPLALQLLEVPVTDLSRGAGDRPSVALFGEGYGLDRADMDFYAAEYLADAVDATEPYASPLLARDLARVAPAHVVTAEYDVLRDSGEEYAQRLQKAGIPTTLRRELGHTHASSVLWQTWEPARAWMDDVVDALRRALHNRERNDHERRASGNARV